MQNRQNIVVLGSTGSIGEQTLQVVDKHPEKFRVVGLAARDEVELLASQVNKYRPLMAGLGEVSSYGQLKACLDSDIQIAMGIDGLCEMAGRADVDTVVIALSGAVGIMPTLAAIRQGKRIALANKETLVAAGDLVMQQAAEYGAEIIPVDSEHSALFQCLAGERPFLRNLWLTASGGPFRDFSLEQLAEVTVDMALQHPNWKMGPKITIDSATLMNKGLEVIEAHHLFGVDYDHIQVVIQKESVIHSMVELVDGSFLGHLGVADMRIPIQYALTYPLRLESPVPALDFSTLGCIHFQKPDTDKFPLLAIAYQAGRQGGTMPAVMNAANEVAVHSFLHHRLRFLDIACLVQETMAKHQWIAQPGIEDIFSADNWAREICQGLIKKGERQ